MGRTDRDENSFWSNVGSLGGAVLGIVLILICLVLSFWVAFVALLIPLIVIVMIAGFVMARQATPEDREEQDIRVRRASTASRTRARPATRRPDRLIVRCLSG